MSDGTSPAAPEPGPPPPGWQPPPPPPPVYPQGGYPAPYAPPQPAPAGYGAPPPGYVPLHQARPVYKPGTIPLRPLGLSDIYSGAIETVRRNPKATLGIAAVVLTCFLAVPLVSATVWAKLADLGSDVSSTSDTEDVGLAISLYAGLFLSLLATTVLTGMIVHVVEHAARGQKLSAGDAWRLTRRRVWRLIGLSFLPMLLLIVFGLAVVLVVLVASAFSPLAAVLLGIFGGLGAFLGMVYLYTRLFLLAAPSLVIEQRGVFAAVGRAWELSRGTFWRLFGITLLTMVVTSFAGNFVALPFAMLGVGAGLIWEDPLVALFAMLFTQYLSQVIAGSITTPFSASVAALQYLDQRIRKEGYDIALISQLPGMPAPGQAAYPQPYPGPPAPPPPYGAPAG